MSYLRNVGIYSATIDEAWEKCEKVFENLCIENEIES